MAAPTDALPPPLDDTSVSLCDTVRRSSASLFASLTALRPSVRIDSQRLAHEITSNADEYAPQSAPADWSSWYHYCDEADIERTVLYVFVIDSINFCFWPLSGYEYADMAAAVKRTILNDKAAFTAQRIAELSEDELRRWLQPPSPATIRALQDDHRDADADLDADADTDTDSLSSAVDIPLLSVRCRALNELGTALKRDFGGSALSLVRSCRHSAAALIREIVVRLPLFRDAATVNGASAALLKRAQILVGDLYGAYTSLLRRSPGVEDFGRFDDMSALTCFADYRVPQLLRHIGILVYDQQLADSVDRLAVIEPNSAEELMIRTATVLAVDEMISCLHVAGVEIAAFQLDWILWERGEAMIQRMRPHHRTVTHFY